MKVLAGNLTETVYAAPEGSGSSAPLQIKSETTHSRNDVTYIADDIGLHRVYNPHPTKVAVSLHCTFPPPSPKTLCVLTFKKVYTPPNAADYGYYIFDEATGKSSYVPQARAILRPDNETSE